MSRRLWIVPLVLIFLVFSFELARYLSASGTERGAVITLLRAQARGDVPGMLAELDGCARVPSCLAQARANALRLTASGRPKILLLESDSAYTLSTRTAKTRVVWADIDDEGPTYVQCVTVRKKWSLIGGADVSLRRIGPRIGNEASC